MGHYDTEYFLVYTDEDKTWWRLNIQTRQLEAYGFPTPGKLAMWRLYQPIHKRGKNVYAHQYVNRVNVVAVAGKALIRVILTILEGLIAATLQSKKSNRSRRR